MWNNARDNAVYQARGALEQLGQRNIDLPDSVTAEVAVLDRINAAPPMRPSTTALREAMLAGASEDEINALLLQDLGFARLQVEHNQAKIDAALIVLRAIRNAHDYLYPQLKALADKQIEPPEAVAALDTVDVMQLVRVGDHRAAQLVAGVDVVAAELDALYSIRDGYLAAGGYEAMRLGPVDASRWRDPEHAGRGNSVADRFLDGLRNGNQLWFPTKTEARAAAQPVYDKLQHQAEQAAKIRRQRNRNAAAFPA
jgi:hypothetical protein